VEVARTGSTSALIEQGLVATTSRGKRETLRQLLDAEDVRTAIIFANRKTTVRELAQSLQKSGFKASEIHGDMDQSSRIKELERFKAGEINILVASDVAARGLDIKGVSHVFNFDAPWHPDDYVHRVGRTGRAGATGKAFTLITDEDAENVANIEKLIGQKIPRVEGLKAARSAAPAPEAPPRQDDRTAKPEDRRGARRPAGEPPRAERARPERARPERARPERDRRDASAPRNQPVAEPIAADASADWNGPIPSFLSVRIAD
jgi:superfamily II DNA/RNA helicase